MEGLTLAVIIATILLNIASAHTHQAIIYGINAFWNYLKKSAKPVNHDLKKALRRAFLSALQNIVLDCHKELYPHKFMGILPNYPPSDQEALNWLDQKRNQLAKVLKQLEQEQFQFIETAIISLEKIESLLNPTGQLADENRQIVKDKLIAEALTSDTVIPDCYTQKVKTQLFDSVCEHFLWEIKYNSVVHNIFDIQLLVQINAQLTEQKLAIQNIVNSSQSSPNHAGATAKITLEVELDDLSTPQLFAMLEELQKQGKDITLKIRRIEEGSVILVLEGSQPGIERLEMLFNSGQLKKMSGILIKNMHVELVLSAAQTPIHLSQWLQNNFGEAIKAGWQTVEEILGTGQLAFRQVQVKRAKSIHLGEQTVVLVVELRTTEEQVIDIFLCVYPIDNKTDLPENLRLSLLSESGKLLEEIQAGNHKNYLEQPLDGVSGERFSVKLALDESSVTEDFII